MKHLLLLLSLGAICSFGQASWSPILPKGYVAYKTEQAIEVDGKDEDAFWSKLNWTEDFIDIEGNKKPAPHFKTRVKICWNDDYLYFLAEMEEPHVWGDIEMRDQVIFYNNDFEIFMKPYTGATHYGELEVNALGTAWDLLLMNAYREGGPIINQWNIDGLLVGVDVDGTLNKASDTDKGWTVEIGIPWTALDELLYTKKHKKVPDPWRINFSRVQWEHELVSGRYQRKKDANGKHLPEYNWVWCEQSAVDMHRPEHWGYLLFSDQTPGSVNYSPDALEVGRQYLYQLYRQQKVYRKKNGKYCELIEALDDNILEMEGEMIRPQMTMTHFGFEISLEMSGSLLVINERGMLKEDKLSDDFVFAVWGRAHTDWSDEEWRKELLRYKAAGVTDFFIGAGPQELKRLVDIASLESLKIHAWIWTLNRPGDSIARQHPEWYAVNRKGQNSLEYNAYVGYYQWLSPFSEGAREHIKNNIRAVAEVPGLASVHLDYVRYVDVILGAALQPKYDLVQDHEMPEYDYGYHPNAREQYKTIFGTDPMEMEHPELSTEWRQFRLNAVTSLVNELSDIVHEHGHKISAAVFPFPTMSRTMVRQDWSNWNLDIALPMIYHNFYNQNLNWIQFVTEQGVQELDGRFPLYSGLYIPSLTPADLEIAIQNSINGGAAGVSVFDMNAITDEHLEVIKKFNP